MSDPLQQSLLAAKSSTGDAQSKPGYCGKIASRTSALRGNVGFQDGLVLDDRFFEAWVVAGKNDQAPPAILPGGSYTKRLSDLQPV